jgi:hypothetical protein
MSDRAVIGLFSPSAKNPQPRFSTEQHVPKTELVALTGANSPTQYGPTLTMPGFRLYAKMFAA